jgi:Fe-S cluster biogenesis protein NfuA
MTARKKVQGVIDRVRPLLRADGGDIELVDVADRKAFVRLTGRCASCPSSPLTLHFGVEHAIRDYWPELDVLVVVR